MIEFTATQMTTLRVRISFIPDTGYVTAVPDNKTGDVASGVFDICGDTTVTFTTPFISDGVYRAVEEFDEMSGHDDPSCMGRWVMQIVNPISTAPGTTGCPVDYLIYMAGAEDFQLNRPDGWAANWAVTPAQIPPAMAVSKKVTKKCDPYAVFAKPFPGLVPIKLAKEHGLASSEQILTVVELMRRFEPNQTLALNTTTVKPIGFDGFSATSWHRRLAWPFLLWRGGTHYKAKCVFANTLQQCNVQINSTSGDIPTVGELSICGVYNHVEGGAQNSDSTEVYIPYNDLLHCREVTPSLSQLPDPDTVSFTTVALAHTLWMAVGDDFTLGPFVGIPLLQYTQPASRATKRKPGVYPNAHPLQGGELKTVSSTDRVKTPSIAFD